MCLTRLGLPAAVVALIGASACTGGGGAVGISPSCAPTPIMGISGCVSNTRGGPAVVGATITAAGTFKVAATTDAQGAYALSLNPGTYDIVASKPGMAASKFQGVVVQAGQTTAANLIMRTVFDPTKLVAAPTISVSGLISGETVTGSRTLSVSVAAGNPVREIDMRTSNMNTGPQFSTPDSSTTTFTFNSALLANGPAFVDIIAYDFNYNIAEVVINFIVSNAPSGAPPSTPTGLTLVAVTTGQSLSLFTAQRASTFSQLGIPQDPTLLVVDGQSINLLAAPPDSTLFVQASWNAVAGVTYKIYRSFSAAGPFVVVAQRNTTAAPQQVYADADPSLAPGLPVYYQVSAVNSGGESAPTAAVSVTPLPAFNLNLTSPANNTTGVSFTPTPPTFTWTPTALVGDHQSYDIYVWGLNDSTFSWRTTGLDPSLPGVIVDTTTISYGSIGTSTPLQAGKVYQWDIYAAQAQTVYIQNVSRAVAVANQSSNSTTVFNLPTGSLNGPFKLTTMQ